MIMKDIPFFDRPRERMVREGVGALSARELLAVVLRSGTRRENALGLADALLKEFSLPALSVSSPSRLKRMRGIGDAKACSLLACFELGRRVAGRCFEERAAFRKPLDIVRLLGPELRFCANEKLVAVCLDARGRMISRRTVAEGTLDASLVHPREVFSYCLRESSHSLVLVHNHPSGDPAPSDEDIVVTGALVKCGELLGIEVLDHVIIGDGRFVSLRKAKLMGRPACSSSSAPSISQAICGSGERAASQAACSAERLQAFP